MQAMYPSNFQIHQIKSQTLKLFDHLCDTNVMLLYYVFQIQYVLVYVLFRFSD